MPSCCDYRATTTSGVLRDSALTLDLADPLLFSDLHECNVVLQPPSRILPEEDETILSRLRRPATVGCISVLMLLIVTFTDFALEVVNAQMHRLDVVHYDALSTEVIRPPFRYISATTERPKLGLGSAAIASVTNVLSPILPFAGGVDLRRDFTLSSDGLLSSLSSMWEHMRDAFAADADLKANSPILNVPRGGGRVPSKLLGAMSSSSRKKVKTDHVVALSAPEPFVPVDQIADLTLSDVASAFRYAVERTKSNFDESGFFSGQVPRVKTLLALVESAVSLSRGKDVKPALTGTSTGPSHGDVDALHFCAAMRIFAEWRLLRQTPAGYKGFALGMSLGQKDIVQNVLKIEQATHAWLDHQRELRALQAAWEEENYGGQCPIEETNCIDKSELRSPTLNDLLQHEIDMEVHDKLPRLKEKSAAMGLLWVRRQLHYQTSLFANILHVPDRFPSTKAAISAAYSEVYDRFHGWAVQKIFNYSFQAAPEAEVVYKFMNPHRLKEVVAAAKQSNGQSHSPHCLLATENDMNPLERFGNHIGKEWDKLTVSVSQLFGAPARAVEMEMRGGSDCSNMEEQQGRTAEDQEQFIVQEMTKDAYQHINSYLTVAQPLLEDLAALFDAHNMDDPTKV